MSELLVLVAICFAVGLFFIMLFTPEGRGCIGGAIGCLFIFVAVAALGGAVLFALFYLLVEFL